MPILNVRKGADLGKVFPVFTSRQPTIIGRDASADVCLQDARASRRNSRISMVRGEWILEDLQSSNGTFVGGSRVTSARLSGGASIRVGATLLTFQDDALASFPDLDLGDTTARATVRETSGVFTLTGYQAALDREVRLDWVHPSRRLDDSARSAIQAAIRQAFELKALGILPLIQAESGKDGEGAFAIHKGAVLPTLEERLRDVLELPIEARLHVVRQVVEVVLDRAAAPELRTAVSPGTVGLDWQEGGPPMVQMAALELSPLVAELTGELADLPAYAPYLAPECQAPGATGGAPAVIYGLGALAYRLLTGTPCAGEGSHSEILENHRTLRAAPASVLVPEIPSGLSDLLDAMLAKDPARRPASRTEIVGRIGDAVARVASASAAAPPVAAEAVRPAGGALRPPPGRVPAGAARAAPRGTPERAAAEPAPGPVAPGRRTPPEGRRPQAIPRRSVLGTIVQLPFWGLLAAGLFVAGKYLSKAVLTALDRSP